VIVAAAVAVVIIMMARVDMVTDMAEVMAAVMDMDMAVVMVAGSLEVGGKKLDT
jgi:hypothetical protein